MTLNLKKVANDKTVSDEELIRAFGDLLSALKERKIIRTKNIVGELGERYCEMVFNEQNDLPDIKLEATNAMDIDAKSDDGITYSIKSVTFTSAKKQELSISQRSIFNRISGLIIY